MSDILHLRVVLHVNRLMQPLGYVTIERALNMIFSVSKMTGLPSAKAVDIQYGENQNGGVDTSLVVALRQVEVADWLLLPIRPFDRIIGSSRGPVRAPTVVASLEYDEMPLVSPKCTKRAIRERDQDVCQYSGEKTPRGEGSVDHLIPVTHGGRTTWENCVWSRRDINCRKGHKSLKQAGLKLLRRPMAPKPVPVCMKATVAHHPDQRLFLVAA